MAGDGPLGLMRRSLQQQGLRTYGPRSAPTSAAPWTPRPRWRCGSSRSPSGAAARCRIVGHSLGGMLGPGGGRHGVPTWSPAWSPWAARCWRRAHTAPAWRRRVDDAGAAEPGGLPRRDGRGLRRGGVRPESFDQGGTRSRRRRASPRSTAGATASSTGVRASTPRPRPSRCRLARRHGHGPPVSRGRPRPGRSSRVAVSAQWSKSMAEKSRSFESGARAVIERIVPLRERMTRECVVAPLPR